VAVAEERQSSGFLRERVPLPPSGWRRCAWYGPGLLWMLSAVGTGSILFTPRVASAYEYQFAWLLLLIVFFMAVMIREMGRYSVVTGLTLMEGLQHLPGPRNWALWFIFIPQLFAAAIGIAGLAAVVGSALASLLPGGTTFYGIATVVTCTGFTVAGKYMRLEKLSRLLALALVVMALVAALVVFPNSERLLQGFVPGWPENTELYLVLPWVGTILAGSMGIVWFGYWTATRGFGGGLLRTREETPEESEQVPDSADRVESLRSWIRLMTAAAALGVGGGFLVILAFMILGAELLAPQGLMPEGPDVAVDLARLFSEVWGEAGKYLLMAAVVVAIGGSVLANQDGWGRSFADISLVLLRRPGARSSRLHRMLRSAEVRVGWRFLQRTSLKRAYIATITGLVPLAIILVFEDPVEIMSVSGIIAAAHTPFIAGVTLLVNRSQLPEGLAPGRISTLCMLLAACVYGVFALGYFWNFLNA